MSGNYFHPLLVHVPLVLPFVLLFLLMMERRSSGENFSPLISLAAAQVVTALTAFYSGSWVGDLLPEDITQAAKNTYEWHYVLGRLVLMLSVLVLISLSVLAVAVRAQRVFFLLAFFSMAALCGTVLCAGYTGGQLVHEFEVNTIIGD